MERLDRTGMTATNKRGQLCRIIAYRNNKDIDVEIIDSDKNKIHTLAHVRFYEFAHGKLFFNPRIQGDDYVVANKQQPFKIDESAADAYVIPKDIITPRDAANPHFLTDSQLAQSMNEEEAAGMAIGCALVAAIFIFVVIILAMFTI